MKKLIATAAAGIAMIAITHPVQATAYPPSTTVPPETSVPETTVPPASTAPPTTAAPETTAPTTTVGPDTTAPTTTVGPETTAATTTIAPETTTPDTLVPPTPLPTITSPLIIGPEETFTISVSNVPVGESVRLRFLDGSYDKTVPRTESVSPVELGSVSFTLVSPSDAGAYPVVAQTEAGIELRTSVTVRETPVIPGEANRLDSGAAPRGLLPSTGSGVLAMAVGIGAIALATGLVLIVSSRPRRANRI